MKFSKAQNTFILACLAAVILLCAYGYLYSKFQVLNSSIVDSSSKVYKDQEQESSIISLRQKIASVQSDKALLDSLFVGSDQVAGFIQNLETLAQTSGVSHTLAVTSEDDPGLAPYSKSFLVFHLTTAGNWKNTMRFLLALENMPNKSFISNVSYSVSGDVAASSSVKTSLWSGSIDIRFIQNK
jgi:hypothetical protein